MSIDTIHKILAFIGGKKIAAVILGVVLWVIYHKTGITPDQFGSVVGDAGNLAAQASDGGLTSILTLLATYIGGQSIADGLSGGKTSSAAVISEHKEAA